ncbi:unnamed protein product, partial [Mesorhabditis belari]|uniref:Uncharacterized protein n=1 Tax=Mesorhabditis belari TaxID=2138241 RepID=A0AAF3ENN9_9BILA
MDVRALEPTLALSPVQLALFAQKASLAIRPGNRTLRPRVFTWIFVLHELFVDLLHEMTIMLNRIHVAA